MMEEVTLKLNKEGEGAFYIKDGAAMIGEMVIQIQGSHLTVYHTEVAAEAEGRGLAKKMLTAMVDYARDHQLQVVPLCPYVHAQFRRHEEEYKDVWKKEG